jgi:hypothetical protein
MYTYAQNFEDVMLNRLFHEQATGLYVDVGAWDPNLHSVTKPFYKGGWHGVNIEPLRSKFDLFERERPRDVNLSLVGWRSRGWRKRKTWGRSSIEAIEVFGLPTRGGSIAVLCRWRLGTELVQRAGSDPSHLASHVRRRTGQVVGEAGPRSQAVTAKQVECSVVVPLSIPTTPGVYEVELGSVMEGKVFVRSATRESCPSIGLSHSREFRSWTCPVIGRAHSSRSAASVS